MDVNKVLRCIQSPTCKKKVELSLRKKGVKEFELEFEKGKLEYDIKFNRGKELIKGGYGDFIPDKYFNKKQLAMGQKVEMEHTKNPRIAKEIAKDHLMEINKDYYTRLAKMESRAKKGYKY